MSFFKTYALLKEVNQFDLMERIVGEYVTEADLDEMAFPAYFSGNYLSRYIFLGRLAKFLKDMHVTSGETVLDFGCGLGILAPYFDCMGCKYYGVDLFPVIAEKYASGLNIDAKYYTELGQVNSEERFDKVVSFDVLEHVENLDEICQMLSSRLAGKGRLLIGGPTENMLYQLGRRIVGFSGDYHHRNIDNILESVAETGLSLEETRTWPAPGPFALFKCGYYINE